MADLSGIRELAGEMAVLAITHARLSWKSLI